MLGVFGASSQTTVLLLRRLISHERRIRSIQLLSLSFNAIVERTFSLVTSVKAKAKKCMQRHLLDAIVRITVDFVLSNKCCENFQALPKMLQNFTADSVHVSAKDSSRNTAENVEDEHLELFLQGRGNAATLFF